MQLKISQTSYALGISSLLTSIVYLFASNWQGFDRYSKIGLSIGLLLLFYIIHFVLRKTANHQPFLGNWLLVAASIVFGITLALIGQIYNSHADSYLLFLIWFIPLCLIAIMTKYVPFYILSFILIHLSIFMFMSPSSYFPEWSPMELLFMYIGIIILNSIIFYFCARKSISSATIFYLGYIMIFGIFFVMTVLENLPLYYILNVIYMLLLAFSIYYWTKIHKQRPLLIITSIFAAIYLLYKVFYWVLTNYGTWILIFLLGFAIFLVFISVIIVGLLNKGKSSKFMVQLITILITIVATLFATLAITGLFFIAFPDATEDALFFFAVIALLLPSLFLKISPQIRYTLLGTGFLLSFTTGVFSETAFYQYILLLLLVVGLFTVHMKGIKVLIYILANMTAAAIVIDLLSYDSMLFLMFLINLGYYLLQHNEKATKNTAFIIGFIYFMNSTVLDLDVWVQIVSSVGFFIVTTLLIIFLDKEKHRLEWTVSIVFWFLFIAYKYYEYIWDLVHKSILFLVLGLILIGIGYYFQKQMNNESAETLKISYKLPILLAIIILQFAFIGYQVGSSEYLLKEGTLVKLELEPVDPRSILQGDYMILRYDITDLHEDVPYKDWNKKVKVVLREKEDVYTYAGFYQMDQQWNKAYEKQPGDVIINGRMYSSNEVQYGIESYFLPEGTGWDLQNEVEYAYVRVGKSGNAIIEKVE